MEHHSINTVITKLLSWILFSVAIGLLPFMANISIKVAVEKQQLNISYQSIFMHGEAFIFCAGLAAGGIGELISAEHLSQVPKLWAILAIGISVIVVICMSIAFAVVAIVQSGNNLAMDANQDNQGRDLKIRNASHVSLVATLLISGLCIFIAARYTRGH